MTTTLHSEGAAGAGEPTVSMLVVQGLLAAVEQQGVARPELLAAAGLDAKQVEASDARLPRSQVHRICELALELTADPALGLHWAERLSGSTFNPVSHLIAHAANLRQGLESLARFERLLSDEPSHELGEHEDKATLRHLPIPAPPHVQRFAAEMAVAGFFRVLRSFGPAARPEQVSFEHAAPPHYAEYARVFEQAVSFEQPFTGLVFDRALLSVPSPHRDADVHEALQAVAERRMSRLVHLAPYALRAREFLVQRGWPERVDMATVARSLGLSARSLRRRLAAEGKSYQQIENDAFAIVAKRLLRDQRRTIHETAAEMGFSDTTTFHRAFKRWTGMTPSSFRERATGASRSAVAQSCLSPVRVPDRRS